MKNVLITRPKKQAKKLASELENAGFKAFVEPLFFVEKLSQKTPAKTSAKKSLKKPFGEKSRAKFWQKKSAISAAILTSANACQSLVESGLDKDVKIFTVGKKTAEKLVELGFKNVVISPKNSAKSLAHLISETEKKKTLPILYFRGQKVSFDFKSELKKSGFFVEEIFSYQVVEKKNFSANFLKFSKKNSFDFVLIFSQNSAEIFLKLVKTDNLLEFFQGAQILCLSPQIATKTKKIAQKIFSKSEQKFLPKKITDFGAIPILKKFYD